MPPLAKRIVATVLVLAVISIGVFVFLNSGKKTPEITPVVVTKTVTPIHKVIGQSVEGRSINSYTYGNGTTSLAFVGGIHGGYEWNSVLLAYRFMNYLEANPEIIPAGLSITVIPSANPDGVYKVIGKEGRFTAEDVSSEVSSELGRFNANKVDLNRNFDCKWQPKSTWRKQIVSAGTSAFSEPEARAIRDFVLKDRPDAVVFWHSQSNAVYASQCEKGILTKTLTIMDAYSTASGYPAVKTFEAYATTGAADDWLASIGVPAITVELKTHETIEWDKNLAGIKALLNYFNKF